MGFFVLCRLARSCSVLILHGKWQKRRKEQSPAQCHVTQRIGIFDKISEHVQIAKSLYQRFQLHEACRKMNMEQRQLPRLRRPAECQMLPRRNLLHEPIPDQSHFISSVTTQGMCFSKQRIQHSSFR